ncbi:MAG: glutamate synthase subunit alpha, partial [Pseudomonadota bacterium]
MEQHSKTQQGLYDPTYEHDACGVGFVVDIKGRRSHQIVTHALTILRNLMHRGACGCEENTGDGAGILLQVPHVFLKRECAKLGIALPDAGRYGTGMVFLPRDAQEARRCESLFADIVRAEGQTLLGWRDVPVDDSSLGPTAVSAEPAFRQIFIGRAPGITD